MKSPDDPCRVCPQTRQAHENTPPHHEFSEDGNLVPKKPKKPEAPPNQAKKPPAEGSDMVTRISLVLMKRALISPEEFAWILSGDPAIERRVVQGD